VTLLSRIRDLSATRGLLPPREFRLLRESGEVVHAEVVSMLIDYDERPHVIAFARDLTQRKKMEARLLLSDRMVSIGTLAAGVAHEINNPLSYLMANIDMVGARLLPELVKRSACDDVVGMTEELERAIEMLDVAREGAARVRDIVRDLRTFTRGDDEERRGPVDVRRVLDAAIAMAWNEIRHRARLVKQYDEVPLVCANEARIGQVFLNLLVNAAQALPVGLAGENEIRVRITSEEGDRVVVTVTDTGPGIPPDILGRIFDPFFTTKPVGVGTGLGLWICQGIVTSVEGQIAVTSPPGEGATFRVSLPASTVDVVAHHPSQPPSAAAESKLRLLVVDDEVAIGRTVSTALTDGFEITTATSGREALERIGGDSAYDVVLCDLMMPDVTGMDLYERVAENWPTLARAFVFITGGAFTERARAFVDRVDLPVVEKPFEPQALSALLRSRARKTAV
jgi:signal transduction histidine kinase/CheY-like chemotaxis protein